MLILPANAESGTNQPMHPDARAMRRSTIERGLAIAGASVLAAAALGRPACAPRWDDAHTGA